MRLMTRLSRNTALLAALVVPALAGCGGSSSQIASSKPAAQILTVPIAFTSGQTGSLTMALTTNTAGTLTIGPAAQTQNAVHTPVAHADPIVLPITLPNGTYLITGTFTPPAAFSVSGTLPAPYGTFTITGTIPSNSQPGSFTLIAGGQKYSGIVPIPVTEPLPMPTPKPTPTPTPTPSTGLKISASTANAPEAKNGVINGPASASKSPGGVNPNGTPYEGQYNVDVMPTGADLSVEIFTLSVSAGQTFSATDPRFRSDFLATATGRYDCDGGAVQVVAVSDQSITLKLNDVHYTASPGSVSASGGFTVNGTVLAPLQP